MSLEAWTKANGAGAAACKREYHDRNREEWCRNNAEKARQFKANDKRKRRAAKHSSLGSFTATEFERPCQRYGNRCLCCGVAGGVLGADHVVPLARGGADDIGNIQPLCGICNRSKFVKSEDYRVEGHPLPGPPGLTREARGVHLSGLDGSSARWSDVRKPSVGTRGDCRVGGLPGRPPRAIQESKNHGST